MIFLNRFCFIKLAYYPARLLVKKTVVHKFYESISQIIMAINQLGN